MKKLILIICGALFVFAIFYTGQGFVEAMMNNRDSSGTDGDLARVAKEMNARLPRQINQDVRLDSISTGPENRVNYQCTLLNVSGTNVDRTQLVEKMKPGLVNAYKTRPGMEVFRARQVEMRYQFRDKNGDEIVAIIVSPKDF